MPVRPERDLPPTAPEAAGTGNGALGKPAETAGRKATELRPRGEDSAARELCPPGRKLRKLLETVGRKARGLSAERHMSAQPPDTFASE